MLSILRLTVIGRWSGSGYFFFTRVSIESNTFCSPSESACGSSTVNSFNADALSVYTRLAIYMLPSVDKAHLFNAESTDAFHHLFGGFLRGSWPSGCRHSVLRVHGRSRPTMQLYQAAYSVRNCCAAPSTVSQRHGHCKERYSYPLGISTLFRLVRNVNPPVRSRDPNVAADPSF